MSDQQLKHEFGPLTLYSVVGEHASFHILHAELNQKAGFLVNSDHIQIIKQNRTFISPCLLSLEGKEGEQKAKATGTIKEIPENVSYIKTN